MYMRLKLQDCCGSVVNQSLRKMATIVSLCNEALRELALCCYRGLIPEAITHHRSMDAIKQYSHGEYRDYGNFYDSLVMRMLLFPEEHSLAPEASGFSLLSCINTPYETKAASTKDQETARITTDAIYWKH